MIPSGNEIDPGEAGRRFEAVVRAGAEALGVPLPQGAEARMYRHFRLMAEVNREMNLTAITDPDEAAVLHYLDSIALLRALPFAGKRVVDVGTGAGFPGVPLMLAEPAIAALTLMDSTEKKIGFVRESCAALGLRADAAACRAEEAGQGPLRASFDIAVARAVTRLSALCELCLPLVKPGGAMIAMKSSDSDGEIAEAENAVRILGGAPPRVFEYRLPGRDAVRRAVVIEKTAPTPPKYPRRWAQIKKSPL